MALYKHHYLCNIAICILSMINLLRSIIFRNKQFLLKDFTMLKVMMSALIVGSVGIYIMSSAKMVNLHISPFIPVRLIAGSMLFGIGMAMSGY